MPGLSCCQGLQLQLRALPWLRGRARRRRSTLQSVADVTARHGRPEGTVPAADGLPIAPGSRSGLIDVAFWDPHVCSLCILTESLWAWSFC